MKFDYQVTDPMGREIDGCVEATSGEAAAHILRRDGFIIRKIEESDDSERLFSQRISKSDLVYVTSQLSIMVQTGINLSAALRGIIQQEENLTLKALLAELRSNVESGEDFSTALARHPRYFDKTFVALVRASEQTGMLGEMLEKISNYQRKQLENGSKVRAAMAYPCLMLLIATGVTIFLLTFVLPKFEPLFSQRGRSLPITTQLMMTVSDSLIDYWYFWIAGVVVAIVASVLFKRSDRGRRKLDHLMISLPLIGPMFRKVVISRSINTLGTMIESGVPVLDAIQLSSEVAGNACYEKLWTDVLEKVSSGNPINQAIGNSPLFPHTLVQMIALGEETGKLDEVLARVSQYYDREVDTSLKGLTSIVEPLMIAAMGVVIGTIVLSLLLPIFQLSRHGG